MKPIFAWNVVLVFLIFLKRSLVFPFCCFPLFLCIDHWGRLSCLFLLFFGTLHSDAYIFPFLLVFSLLFFYQLFGRPPQTAIWPFYLDSCKQTALETYSMPGTLLDAEDTKSGTGFLPFRKSNRHEQCWRSDSQSGMLHRRSSRSCMFF